MPFGTRLLGVVGQVVLGAIIVKQHLLPELVIGYFVLSMVLIDAAFAFCWCATCKPDQRRRRSRLPNPVPEGLLTLGPVPIGA